MAAESTIDVACPACKTVLRAKEEHAGKRAKCPKCGAVVEIPSVPAASRPTSAPLATERQKEYARSLGIDFRADITRSAISSLIDEAVAKRDEEQFKRTMELSRCEGEAWEKMRREVLADIDAEDCRLSKASPSQIVEALYERGFVSILISMASDEYDGPENLQGCNMNIVGCDALPEEEMKALIVACGNAILRQHGTTRAEWTRRPE